MKWHLAPRESDFNPEFLVQLDLPPGEDIPAHRIRAVFDRHNITSTDDVKDAIKTVSRYNRKKAGKSASGTIQVYLEVALEACSELFDNLK